MRIRLLPILLFAFCVSGYSQTRRIEFLKNAVLEPKTDEEAADLYCELADKLYSFDFESGLVNAQKSLELATRSKYERGRAEALTSIGTYYYFNGDNNKARDYYGQALKAVNEKTYDDFPIRTYFRLAILYRQQAYFDSSIWYLDKAESLLQGKKEGSLLGSLFAIRGILANQMSNNVEALALLKRALQIRKALPDSSRLSDTWRNLGATYGDLAMYDSAEYCYDQASLTMGSERSPELEMSISLSRGETNFSRGNQKEAAKNYNDALDKLKSNTYKRYYSFLLFKIGELYESQGAYNTAYEYLFNSLKEFESLNARQDVARAYSQIGWCYNYQENYSLAIENGQKSLTIAQILKDSASIAQNQNLIGYALLKSKRYDEALVNFDQALKIRKHVKHWWGVTYTLYNLALTYEQLGLTDKAFDLLFESLELNERIGNKSGIVFVCNEIGLLYAKTKQFEKSDLYLTRAGSLAKNIPLPSQLVTNYKNRIFLYEERNDPKKTIQFFKLYTSLKDSLSNQLGSSRMAEADAMFQLQKKAEEIQLKNKENELQQEKIAGQQNVIKLQQRVLTIVIISLAILAVLVVVIYRLLSARTKAKEILRKQNIEIYEQKEEIQAQSEELTETNSQLILLNHELTEKNHEIEVQSEKIQEANSGLEKRVEERTRQLNVAYSELETFFYKTSHDFRRPLTTYLGLVEIAKVSVKDEQALALFERVKETTHGLDNMLIKLQSISNIDYETQMTDVPISNLIAQSLEKYKSDIKARKIKVVVEDHANVVRTNEHLCRVFIENIIENSIDFCTPLNPYLRIHVNRNDKTFSFIIEDNGQGIPATIQHRIFEMYFRGNDSSKGNGLGLYIAKRAVDKLGGTITFMSRLNEGTSFKVAVPIPSQG